MMCELSHHCHIYDNHTHYMGLQCNYFHLTIRNPIIGLLTRILASKFKDISFLKSHAYTIFLCVHMEGKPL